MIISEFVEIILNSKNKKRLINLGYKGEIKEKIKIAIEHLSNGSKFKIIAKCDNCGNNREVCYNNYNKQTNNNIKKYYCLDCKEVKTKETCLEKYGYENPNSSDIIKEKIISTNIEKYGVRNVFQSEKIKEKIRETNTIKYGKNHYNNREKSKETCLERYGVEHPMQNEDIKQKSKDSCMEKYGVESYMQTKEFRKVSMTFYKNNWDEITKKTKITNLDKYGVENVFANYQIQEKIKETCLKRYGVKHPIQNEAIFLKTQKSRFKIDKYKDTDIYSQGSYEKS